ncbi:unnamed protein product [Ectocarpus fasciculatus]
MKAARRAWATRNGNRNVAAGLLRTTDLNRRVNNPTGFMNTNSRSPGAAAWAAGTADASSAVRCYARIPNVSSSNHIVPSKEEEVLPGAFKSPITQALWEIRRAEMEFQEKRREAGGKAPQENVRPVPPSLSRSAIHYPFSTDSFLREDYRNPGGLVRIGRILEDLDALAGNIAFKHCSEDPSFPLLVTASVDRIVLRRHPELDCDITLMGRVVWTGRSSMVINMRQASRCSTSAPGVCYVGDDPWADGDDDSCWLDANFTFVARDRETGRSRAVSPLDLGTDPLQDEPGDGSNGSPERDPELGWRALWRVVHSHKSRQALERNAAKKARGCSALPLLGAAAEGFLEVEAARLKREEEASKLVAAGFPLLHLPALANPHAVLMSQTVTSSTLICMPQHRNTANRIFGGFLMHRAYEVAFCAAFTFGGSRPRFSEIDEVVFLQPVDVGDLVKMDACVLYTKEGKEAGSSPQACVEVLASVVRPEAVDSKVSNRFNLTFSFPELAKGIEEGNRPGADGFNRNPAALLRTVLPANATEASRIVAAKHRDRLQDAADETEGLPRG